MSQTNYIKALIRGESGDDAKSRIFAAALEEFGLNSLAAVRTRAIAKRAGVNHAAISYYFGGKDELYSEIANQIIDFIKIYDSENFVRFESIKKSKSPSDAKVLIKDVLASRVCCDDSSSQILRNIILIIMREEMSNSATFEIFFNKAFKPFDTLMCKLVEIASDGKYSGEQAAIVAKMLIGQVHFFNNAYAGIKSSMGWKVFDRAASQKVIEVSSKLVDKIFN